MTTENLNRKILVIGYGSLLSGYGLMAERRGGRSRLLARDVDAVSIHNARRGLAKPSSHGSYLAMDIEPLDRSVAITASIGRDGVGIGGLVLTFDRESARIVAQREEYDPDAFERLLTLADRAGQELAEFLMSVARETHHDLLEYRRALREIVGYTSPGYIFHPVELDDGRVAIIAIGAGFEGSGDPGVRSKRNEFGMDRLLSIHESLTLEFPGFDRAGQLGYFAECLLGGLHGLSVADLAAGFDPEANWAADLAERFRIGADGERDRFLSATSIDFGLYQARFAGRHHESLAPLLKFARLG